MWISSNFVQTDYTGQKTMNVFINRQYEHLRDDIMRVVAGDYVAVKIYCHKRNVVEKVVMQGGEYVVKTYKRPNFLNRVVYSFLRKSKAERAFLNARRLYGLGVDTPSPVAYVEVYKRGLFSRGYYIAEFVPYRTMRDAFAGVAPESDDVRLKRDFVNFTLSLHGKGVLPLDFNSGNIFYHYDDVTGEYRFALTDINRMRFGRRPSVFEVMRSFEQFGVQVDALYKLAVYYCSCTGRDPELSMFAFLYYRLRSRVKHAFKEKLSRYHK